MRSESSEVVASCGRLCVGIRDSARPVLVLKERLFWKALAQATMITAVLVLVVLGVIGLLWFVGLEVAL